MYIHFCFIYVEYVVFHINSSYFLLQTDVTCGGGGGEVCSRRAIGVKIEKDQQGPIQFTGLKTRPVVVTKAVSQACWLSYAI